MRAPLFVDADIRILKMREHVCIEKNNPFDFKYLDVNHCMCCLYFHYRLFM